MARGMEEGCNDVYRLFTCYNRGQAPQTPSPRIGKKSRTYVKSPCEEGEAIPLPLLREPSVESPFTPQQAGRNQGLLEAAHQNPLAAGAVSASECSGRSSMTKELSPGVFYGSPDGKAAKTPVQVERLLRQICRDRVAAQAEEDVRSPAVWATFPRQDQAIQFASTHGSNVAVFVFQDHMSGQRRFLATTLDEFWIKYEKMQPCYRHHYELVREGLPCHLYFDLEYNRKANPDANGEKMVDLLLTVVADALAEFYSLKFEAGWTVELDSSTEDKFSRHLIIRAPKVAFKDNSHVGAFVGDMCTRIGKLRNDSSQYDSLFVLKGDSRADHHTEIFVDKAVYSRNRSFRLPFSSKAGKTARLEPTHRFRCAGLSKREVFMDSLICRVDGDCNLVLTFGLEVPGRGSISNLSSQPQQAVFHEPNIGGAFHISGKSPFPKLDVVVETIASVDGIPGKIRSWYWFSEYGVLVFNISGNRYCENIGRQHKSNNVMYIVDFRTAGYYQKCHDPNCRAYRSQLRPIPRDVIPPEFPLSTARHDEQRVKENEDESWWAEVVSSMASMECPSQPQNQDTDEQDCEDESWWLAVEEVIIDLEAKKFGNNF